MQKLLLLLLALLLTIPAAAQDFSANQRVVLVPFMIEALDVQGLRPRGWREQANGVYIRARDPLDLTAVLMQAREGTAEALLSELVSQFELAEAPAVFETLESEYFSWTLYQFPRSQNNQTLTVDVAFAEDEETGRVYYVLMQTTDIFRVQLRSELFLPVVQTLSPIQRYVDPEGRFDVPIPTLWLHEAFEDYAVLHDAENTIKIFVSAVEGDDVPAALEAFWFSLYPDFGFTYDPATDIRTIEDPARIGGLERVYIVDWDTGSDFDGFLKQGVGRVYNGVIYMTLIETTAVAILDHEEAITLVDNNYRIMALLPEATPEATQGL
jgi:hypothetical protein